MPHPYDIIGYRLEADYKISKYPAISIIAHHIKKAVHIDLKENTTKYVMMNKQHISAEFFNYIIRKIAKQFLVVK